MNPNAIPMLIRSRATVEPFSTASVISQRYRAVGSDPRSFELIGPEPELAVRRYRVVGSEPRSFDLVGPTPELAAVGSESDSLALEGA